MPTGPLYRSQDDKLIAGVCGGLARYLNWDPLRFRVVYALLTALLALFPGVVVYIVLALVLPVNDG